ncbi:MAG: UDP-N-acetylmuramate dehydrogenase [Rhodospirillales bacterium]|nr:UDP-N-acetylmuramate dehydrogenase [Rhodospirillales bacterium]
MIVHSEMTDWIERLPAVRGRYALDVDLSRTVWFRAGGRADVVFRPADIDDLSHFLSARPADVPVTVVGLGSNLLVRDGGVEGVVIRLRQGFRDVHVRWEGDRALVEVGAGALDVNVARYCRDQGVDGLAFLSGIPGTIGGALRMNAGAYGYELADVVVEARALDRDGAMHALTPDAMGLSYRHSAVPDDWIFVSAVLTGRRGEPAAIARHMEEINAQREASQPIRARTGGSTFTNPAGHSAWELIDEAGCRGLTRGGAQISEQHCNFIVNAGGATASDIEGLGEEVRRRVEEKTGLSLRWEIRRIGRHGRWPHDGGESAK